MLYCMGPNNVLLGSNVFSGHSPVIYKVLYSGNYKLNDRKVFQFAQVSLMPPFCYCFVDSFLSAGKLSKRRLRRTTFESRIRKISSGYCSNIFLPKSISAIWPDKDLEVEKWKTVSLLVQFLISSQLEVLSG